MTKLLVEDADFDEIKGTMSQLVEAVKELQTGKALKEVWLDNQEVCLLLKISKRTLQTYRDEGKLGFSQVGSKIYYRSTDIERHLNQNYVSPRKGNTAMNRK